LVEETQLIYWEQNGEIKKEVAPLGRRIFLKYLRGDYIPGRPHLVRFQYGAFRVETIFIRGVPADRLETYTIAVWEPDWPYCWQEIKIFKGFVKDEWL
jgi:hypothetical protein